MRNQVEGDNDNENLLEKLIEDSNQQKINLFVILFSIFSIMILIYGIVWKYIFVLTTQFPTSMFFTALFFVSVIVACLFKKKGIFKQFDYVLALTTLIFDIVFLMIHQDAITIIFKDSKQQAMTIFYLGTIYQLINFAIVMIIDQQVLRVIILLVSFLMKTIIAGKSKTNDENFMKEFLTYFFLLSVYLLLSTKDNEKYAYLEYLNNKIMNSRQEFKNKFDNFDQGFIVLNKNFEVTYQNPLSIDYLGMNDLKYKQTDDEKTLTISHYSVIFSFKPIDLKKLEQPVTFSKVSEMCKFLLGRFDLNALVAKQKNGKLIKNYRFIIRIDNFQNKIVDIIAMVLIQQHDEKRKEYAFIIDLIEKEPLPEEVNVKVKKIKKSKKWKKSKKSKKSKKPKKSKKDI